MTRDRPGGRTGLPKPVVATRSISIRTVAERAGVSIATVSNVINNRTTVGPVLAKRVRDAVEELGYVTDNAASRLRSGRHSLAGVIVPNLKTPMFASFVSALEDRARQDGFEIIVASCRDDPAQEAERLRAIRAWRPAGCIVIPVDGALKARRPKGLDVPIVIADRFADDDDFDLIAVDNAAASTAMMRHLAAQGYRDVLVAAFDTRVSNVQARWAGAQAGASQAMTLELIEVGLNLEGGTRALRGHLAGRRLPDVVFCLDHVTARAAYRVLGELGVPVPQVGLASFDHDVWMDVVAPSISAVCQPIDAMAETAWAHLMRRIGGDASPPETVLLPCTLVFRGSTSPAAPPVG